MEGLVIPKYPILEYPSQQAAASASDLGATSSSFGGAGGGSRSGGRLAARPASAPFTPGGPGDARMPVLGWTDPQGLLPKNRTSPTHFVTGLATPPPRHVRGQASQYRTAMEAAEGRSPLRPASRGSVQRAARALI